MRVIVRRRTRVSQSSHSLVAKLLSMACPCLCFGRRKPQVRAEKAEGKVSCDALREEDNAERTEARLVRAAQLADQREQRQVHGNDHAADHHAEKNDHDGFESSQQVLHGSVHFLFVEIGDLLEHGVHGACLFADGNHLRHHTREDFGISQWFRERLAFLERFSYLLQRPLDDRVSSGPRGDVESFQDGYAAGDQRSERSSKPGHGDLSHQDAKDGKFEHDGVNNEAALLRAIPDFQSKEGGPESHEDQKAKNTTDEIAHPDDDFRGQRKINAKSREQRGENRHHFPEQQGDDTAGHGQNADRIYKCRFDDSLQLDVLFDVGRKALQNGVENTPRFARFDHVHVQRVEDLRRGSHRSGKRRASFDLTARADQDLLKEFVLLLTRQYLETLHERQTGVDHDRELAREDREFLGLHATAELGHVEFLALLGHFGGSDLLALQQVRQFRLIGCGHDTADAGAGAAGSLIFVIRHVMSS